MTQPKDTTLLVGALLSAVQAIVAALSAAGKTQAEISALINSELERRHAQVLADEAEENEHLVNGDGSQPKVEDLHLVGSYITEGQTTVEVEVDDENL